jgi:hypothetical protein
MTRISRREQEIYRGNARLDTAASSRKALVPQVTTAGNAASGAVKGLWSGLRLASGSGPDASPLGAT